MFGFARRVLLEAYSQAELRLPLSSCLTRDPAKRRRVRNIQSRRAGCEVVKNICELHACPDADALLDLEILGKGHIHIPNGRGSQIVIATATGIHTQHTPPELRDYCSRIGKHVK